MSRDNRFCEEKKKTGASSDKYQKGVVRFGKSGKLNPRYIGPFEILERIRTVAYKLKLPEELSSVHDTFHVSNLKKSPTQETFIIPADEIHINDKLQFTEELVEVTDWKVHKTRRSHIKLVKVRWNSHHGPEFTWEREDQIKSKYPHLFHNSLATDNAARISGRNSFNGGRM
ncbi:uncharacterized protein LOC118488209 [Helianthus annuus]|uniref:uncharacterized protein LOC118488209 n=1 Tax=Helianthus annuus TaxID=4232 RepID=UPI0016530740|nr:uncharacterized protein LOC118488209 [Helianthus annuus]